MVWKINLFACSTWIHTSYIWSFSFHQNHFFIFHSFTVYVNDVILAWKLLKYTPHFIQNQAFRWTQILYWLRSCSFQSLHFDLPKKILSRHTLRFWPTDYKPVSTRSDPSSKLRNDASSPYPDIPSYRRLVGRLLYLNLTRSSHYLHQAVRVVLW